MRLARKLWEMTVSSSMVTIVRENNVLRMSCNKLRKRLGLRKEPGVLTQISTGILDIPLSLGSRESETGPQ